jgi:hypothetical protein
MKKKGFSKSAKNFGKFWASFHVLLALLCLKLMNTYVGWENEIQKEYGVF